MPHSLDRSTMTTLAGLNLALSYENAAVDRLEKRLSESIDPEVKEKINRHLAQTREQQD
jgi:ferritin-like metal-binding protein YciE